VFLHLCNYYVRIICTKGEREQMWKRVMSGHDPVRMCFKHKQRMKLDHKIKDIKIVFLSRKLWFLMEHGLSWVFYFLFFFLFGHADIFLSFIVVCTHLKCYITSDAHFIMWKEITQRIFSLKNEKCIILLNVVPMYFFY
jgi:hypothetical protein